MADSKEGIYNISQLLFFGEEHEYKSCISDALNTTVPEGWCPQIHDKIMCWSASPPSKLATQSCFSRLFGREYDTTQNATRYCTESGVWKNYTNYTLCQEIGPTMMPVNEMFSNQVHRSATLYKFGYIVSLVHLCVAVAILLSLKELRCLRNRIHINLFMAYISQSVIWFLNLYLQDTAGSALCTFLIICMYYFQLSYFFWILVEGLYLFLLVVIAFIHKFNFMIYLSIGWGLPVVVTILWSISQMYKTEEDKEILGEHNCAWYEQSLVSWWIFEISPLAIIFINSAFAVIITKVVVTKLRSRDSNELRTAYKAAKAFFVLMPLLGVNQLFVLLNPNFPDHRDIEAWKDYHAFSFPCMYEMFRNLFISLQGTLVAIHFCFANNEVQNAIRHRYRRWKESRQIGSEHYMKCDNEDVSRRTKRTGKRESTSEITTMTTVHSSRMSSGSTSGRHEF